MTIFLTIFTNGIPSERAASICPTPMVLMPLMRFSEQKAEGMRITATTTQV